MVRSTRFLIAVVLLFSARAWAAEPPPWEYERLDLEITVAPPALTVRGEGTVRLKQGTASELTLGWNARSDALRVTRLEVAEAAPAGTLDGKRATFTFASPRAAGTSVAVRFEVALAQPVVQLFSREDGAYASWVEGWYPVPADRSEEDLAAGPAAGLTRFRLPKGWEAVSNGRRLRDGSWRTDLAVARSFVAGPYAARERVQSHGREVSLHLHRPRPATRRHVVALAQAIVAMEARFGPFPYASYAVAELPRSIQFAAASEQGFIVVRSDLLDSKAGNLPLFAHEAGHAWWGNQVATRGPGARMVSEALAQTGAVLAIEALEGVAAARTFLRYSRENYSPHQCAVGYFHIWRTGGDVALARLGDAKWDHHLSDSKGMWFFHMLRMRLGDARFFTALRTLQRDFAGRQASLDDLRAVFAAAAPDDEGLRVFLAQWLDRPGAPVLDVDWWSEDRGRAVAVHVRQRQPGPPYQLTLELDVTTAAHGTVRRTVELTGTTHAFQLEVPSRPLALTIDPRDQVLLWRPEYGPRPEAPENGADAGALSAPAEAGASPAADPRSTGR